MFNLEGLLPKLCQLGQEEGGDDRRLRLRSAGLQALASMVRFMAEFSHISMEFDEIVLVTLDNYEGNQNFPESEKNGAHFHLMQNPLGEELLKKEGPVPSFQGSLKKVSSLQITNNVELVATTDTSKSPSCWSTVCLHNMAELAKEDTTMRRVLEPLFRNFDNGNLWSREKEIAYAILSEIQVLMEKSEQNSHLLLSLMVKHLDHKNVTKQPSMQIDIVNVATCLAQDAKLQASIPIVAEISDMIRHLRKCLEASSSGGNISRRNSDLHSALEECLLELTNKELASMRLSSRQVSLLLSSIWAQATLQENLPANYEAMPHTYNLALLFSHGKTSSHAALARCFQLAFSLRSISQNHESCLQPFHRRSLYTLASSMLIFAAKAADLPSLISSIKAEMTEKMVDPYLCLVEDNMVQAICVSSSYEKALYGSDEDEAAALKFLKAVESDDDQIKEMMISHFVQKFKELPEKELMGIKEQLLQEFSPDEALPLGAPLFLETPNSCSPLAKKESLYFDEAMDPFLDDEVLFSDACGSQSDRKMSESTNSVDILSVNQLIESVLETTQQVATILVSTTPVPYDQMKNQCEALVMGKQQKCRHFSASSICKKAQKSQLNL